MKQEELLEQHLSIYLNSIEELIKNNSYSLVEDDLLPLFKKPPLETMDTIKQKMLSLGKHYYVIINTEQLDRALEEYRNSMQKKIKSLKKYREDYLIKDIRQKSKDTKDGTFRILKKDLTYLDKNLKKEIKNEIENDMQKLIDNIPNFFQIEEMEDKLKKDATKYFKTTYPRNLMETIDMKVIVNLILSESHISIRSNFFDAILRNSPFEEGFSKQISNDA